MKELNLCEILKGHEGETFYSPICGDILFYQIDSNRSYPIRCSKKTRMIDFTSKGEFYKDYDGECQLFPSKDQRDWDKWIEEQKSKAPKTWSELEKVTPRPITIYSIGVPTASDAQMNSALALLKIQQLIEFGYGGNVTNEKWKEFNYKDPVFCIIPSCDKTFIIHNVCGLHKKRHIAFYTMEQAEEFLKYPENIQLLKDYFMI